MADKFIFVTGGVCSSLGKGIAAASIGTLLEAHNYQITMIKVDPYINVDAGTMSPFQHGEVFVTDDGAETDLDLGNYSRFTHSKLSGKNSLTTGQIYQSVIRKERKGEYLGKCVQVIPHITDEICSRIYNASHDAEIAIIEIGGTVGDIESIPFLEAARQIILSKGHNNAILVHLTLAPEVGGEIKTKPTQHAVKETLAIGLQPDILLVRSPKPLDIATKRKVALFTNINEKAVISAHDEPSHIYRIPLNYQQEELDLRVLEQLSLTPKAQPVLDKWQNLNLSYEQSKDTVCIAMVGKYIDLPDTYKSVDEALLHGALSNKCKLKIKKIDAQELEQGSPDFQQILAGVNGILVPGGFGIRGVQGMIQAAKYAREQKIPYLGICLGMQIMVIEFARHVLGLSQANSTEFMENTPEPVISLLEEQGLINQMGGSMRLGASPVRLIEGSKIAKAYGSTNITERHRHRYEFNNRYIQQFEENGMKVTGRNPKSDLVEACEWQDHPWGVGIQAHPEFLSKPVQPHPLFSALLHAAYQNYKENPTQ